MRLTFDDLLDYLYGYAGKDASRTGVSAVRAAAQAGIRELQGHHDWAYYRTLGRLNTVASYATGTVEFDYAGGANERQLTLTSGTWPSWAADGYVVISDAAYDVDTRVSGSIVTLTSAQNPGEDVAAGTGYTIAQDVYSLPSDFGRVGTAVIGTDSLPLTYCDPQELVAARRNSLTTGRPTHFTVLGSPAADGAMVMKLWPAPDAVYRVDFDYRRRPAEVKVEGVKAGTVSITASSTTVTGTDTSFDARMVGSVFRVSRTATEHPTGLSGLNPAAFEAVVSAVASATSLTLATAADQTLSRVKYLISDPVDVEPGSMETALYRLCENAYRVRTRTQPLPGELAEMVRSLAAARDDDSRFHGTRSAGEAYYGRNPFRGTIGSSSVG